MTEDVLEYLYRKTERGLRIIFRNKDIYQEDYFIYMREKLLFDLQEIKRQLGRKPISPRWPL